MDKFRANLMVCGGTGCVSGGGLKVKQAVEAQLKEKGLDKEINVVLASCSGFCAMGPIMTVYPDGIFYQKLTPADAPLIVEQHLLKGKPVEKLMYREPLKKQAVPAMKDIPFFNLQVLRALRNKGLIDPESIEEYIARDGYQAAAKALTRMTPEEIVKEVKASGLRGRGGAGFPTGLKWESCANAPGPVKYIVSNDPAVFMDFDPHVILEGMIIGARAVGAGKGYIYMRNEYPLAMQRLQKAMEQAREYGLLGENILGSGFSLDIEIFQGAGAFIAGVGTALLRSIEGKRGMPVPKPPHSTEQGLWRKPTLLNNMETWANIPPLILNGADWFRSLGTEKSPGTKVFAITGAINNGLVEVPMGTPLRKLIFDIGGGIKKGRTFKAVQLGGATGGILPEQLLDIPATYEDFARAGAIMGGGGVAAMDNSNCMVSAAKFSVEFVVDESCGKCPPCRIGTKVLLDKLVDITEGRGVEGDIELMEDLAREIADTSLCGLGQTAPNPVLSTLKYFRQEYEEHIREGWCKAGVCRPLATFHIDAAACKGCGACARACPQKAITGEKKQPHVVNQELCIKCRSCWEACKFGAVQIGPAGLRQELIDRAKGAVAAKEAETAKGVETI
ncbi:MAG: 4Fe-4S binding protein [Nitrospiraceae bacterium]|nr:4Fe-4S binding protein [Nitrospiraceae bacterium]